MKKENIEKERSLLDKAILFIVIIIAGVVIGLSFQNTAKLALELKLNPYLTAGLVELLFGSLLFIRGRQRATQRNVPTFLTAGYFSSFLFVTGVNMWGLALESPTIGPIVGIAISGAMWLMESVLVWLWVDSHRPHKKKMKELKREAKKQIEEIKLKQQLNWMLWEAQKPDMTLIEKARKVEERRKAIAEKGMPEFFRPDQDQSEKDQSNNQLKNTYPINQADYFQPIVQALIQSFIQSINNQSDKRESIMIDHSIHSRSNNQPDQSEKDQSINHELINQSFQSIDHRSINQDQSIMIDHTPIDQSSTDRSISQSDNNRSINHDENHSFSQSVDQSIKDHPINQSGDNQSIIIDQSGDDQSNVIDQSVFDHTPIDQSGDSQSIDHESINQDQSIDQGEEITFNQSSINQESITADRSEFNQSPIDQSTLDQSESIDQETKQIDRSTNKEETINHSVQSIDQSEDDQSQNDQSEINQTIKNDRSDMEESIIKQESIKQEEERKTIDQSTKSNVLNFDEELASRYPIKEALEYYKKHGKIPTHRGLKEIANTTLHRASMAVKWLKEQIEQGKVA